MPPFPLGVEFFEHLNLVGEGRQIQIEGNQAIDALEGSRAPLTVQRRGQPVPVAGGVVLGEGRIVPVLLEGRSDPVDDLQVVDAGDANIPFEALDHRRLGEVRRADVGRVIAGRPIKQPGLGVEARLVDFVRDFDLGAQANEVIECSLLGGPGVDTRDHAKLATTSCEVGKLLPHQPQTRKSDERTKQIHPVGALDL